MAQLETINTPQDYVNYTFNIEARGIAEVSGELMGLSNTVNSLLGLVAFKTSEFLNHTETMAIGTGVAISAMFASATKDAIRFQQQVANVKAIGGESVDAQSIGDAAMEFSNKFGMATANMTEGLEALARAGITTTNVMKGVLEEGVKLSKLEGMDLEDSINDLISTTNLLSTDDVDMNAPEYAEMLKTMNQHIVSTSESAPINAQNIIQSLQHVGGYASASGMDQDDLFAVIAQLGARGTKGEMAGTALRAFIAAGQKDTAQRALARIGLNVTDLWNDNGETMLSISEMKDVLDDALEARGYSKQEKLEFYSDFAGYKQANQIMKIDTSEVAKYKETIADAWDLGTKLDTILGTIKGNLDRIWQIAQNFMTKVGSKLLTIMGAILAPVRVALELFTKIPFADTAVAAGILFIGFRTGLMIFNKLVPALGGFMSGLKNVKKESFRFNQIWKDTKKEMTLTKEIFDNITDQQSLTKIHLRERGLAATDKADVERQIAAQMYMGSSEYKKTGLEWKELPNAVQNALIAQYKTTDAFDKNYKLYIEETTNFVNNATKDPIEIKEFKKKDQLTSINNYVKYIFELFKGKFEKDDRSKQGKGGKGNSNNSDFSSGSEGNSDGSPVIKAPSERIEEYRKIGQRIQSQANEYGDYLWESSIPEVRNPVESFDIQSLIDTRDKIIADINKKMDNYSTFSPDSMNNIGIERLKKSLTRDAMTDFGIAFSMYSNTSDIRQILSTGQYRKGASRISGAQIDAIAEELGLNIKAPKNLDEKSRENLMLTLSNYYKSKFGDDQSILNNISNRTQKIWHNEQVNKEDVSFFPTHTLAKYSDTTEQIQSLLGVQSIKGIQDYFKNNKNNTDYNDNLSKTIKIMSENSDLVDDLVNAEIKYMYENLVRVQNTIQKISSQKKSDVHQDRLNGHGEHQSTLGMIYDASNYFKRVRNKQVASKEQLLNIIHSNQGNKVPNDIEELFDNLFNDDYLTNQKGNYYVTRLMKEIEKIDKRTYNYSRFTRLNKEGKNYEILLSPENIFNAIDKNPKHEEKLLSFMSDYVDQRLGQSVTRNTFKKIGTYDKDIIPIPYEYSALFSSDITNNADSRNNRGWSRQNTKNQHWWKNTHDTNTYSVGQPQKIPRPTPTIENAKKILDTLGPEALLNTDFAFMYDSFLRPSTNNSYERLITALAYGQLDNVSKMYAQQRPYGGIGVHPDITKKYDAFVWLDSFIHEFSHMGLQQSYRRDLNKNDPLHIPRTDGEYILGYNQHFIEEFEANWISTNVIKNLGVSAKDLSNKRVNAFYKAIDERGLTSSLQWDLYDEWIKVITDNIEHFIDVGQAFDAKYSSLNPNEINQKWDEVKQAIFNSHVEEIVNLRAQIAEQEALWAKQGEQYAQEKIKQQKELREQQQKAYQEERRKLQEQQKQQAELYKETRKKEKERLQEKWDKNKSNKPKTKLWFDTYDEEKEYLKQTEKSKPLFDRMRNNIKSNTGSDKWYFAGEERWKDNDKQTTFQKKLQKWGLWGIDKAEEYTNKGKEKLIHTTNAINETSWQYAREQTGEGVNFREEQLDNIAEKMTNFRNVLSGLSEIFPQLIPAVMALDYALTLQEYLTKGLKFASDVLTVARGEESMATMFETEAKQGSIAATFMMTAANWAESESTWQRVAGTLALAAADMFAVVVEKVLIFLRAIGSAGILAIAAAILIVVAAIEAVKFWENKHAEALKESQKALQESTAKNNIALSQYKDMKKAREAETDSIKKQQKARKEAIALYKLEAARIEKQKAIYEESKLRNDSVWGEYGLRASMQKMGLGFIAGGDFESQYEKYEGVTSNIRKVKEDTIGNFNPTAEQKYVSSVYDNNSMFFAQLEGNKDALQKLYDVETKLINKYGSIDVARGTKEFEDAVREFADATGLNGEIAGLMLDYLEAENRVQQGMMVANAKIAQIHAKYTAERIKIEYGDKNTGLEDINTLQDAMLVAEIQSALNEQKTSLWWDTLFMQLDSIWYALTLRWHQASITNKKIELNKEEIETLNKSVGDIYKESKEAADRAERKDYGTGSYTIMDADTPFGVAKEAAAMDYADTQQQKLFNKTGQIYTENEYLAIQDQYKKDTFGTTVQQNKNKTSTTSEKNREEPKKKQNEKKQNEKNEIVVTQLQENKQTAHQDALDIIDAIKNPGVISGVGAGTYTLSNGDTSSIKSLSKKILKDIFSYMRGEEGTFTSKIINFIKGTKTAYTENGFRGVYNYGKSSIKSLGNQAIDKLGEYGIDIKSQARKGLNLYKKGKVKLTDLIYGKETPTGRVKINFDGPNTPIMGRTGGLKGIYEGAKSAYAENGWRGLGQYSKDLTIQGIEKVRGVSPNAASRAKTAIETLASQGIERVKGAPSAIKGAFSEAGGLKGIHANTIKEMKSAFSPKALAGGIDDVAKGLKGGGTLMKGIGRLGGRALMVLGPALAFADKASELNPFEGPHYNEDGTEKKALQATGEVLGTTAGALGGVAGGMEGAAIGAALGTAILPGIGTAIGAAAGGIAGGWLGDTIFQPIGEAIGGTIGWLGDNLLSGIQNVASNVWDGLKSAAGNVWDGLKSATGEVWDGLKSAAGEVWDAVSEAATGAWEFLTSKKYDNRVAGMIEWLYSDENNNPYKNIEKITGQKIPKGEGQSKNTIIIKNININTEDDPEKIKSAFMNLMIELQEQVNPRQVSRTVGEPPQAQSSNTNENNEGENGNQNQAEGSDNDSTNPTI